jgi:iron complex transport system ATP-binding protein
VFEAVLSGRLPHSGGHVGTADLEVVGDTLVAMNLTELSGRRLGSLSGGQLQRVIVARALAQRPSVLLLDEPTNHLDLRAQKDVAERLADAIARLGIAVVLVLHDINLAVHLADRLVFMKSGRLLAVRRPAEVDAPLVQEVYGVPVVELSSGSTSFFVPQWLEE